MKLSSPHLRWNICHPCDEVARHHQITWDIWKDNERWTVRVMSKSKGAASASFQTNSDYLHVGVIFKYLHYICLPKKSKEMCFKLHFLPEDKYPWKFRSENLEFSVHHRNLTNWYQELPMFTDRELPFPRPIILCIQPLVCGMVTLGFHHH